MDLLQIKMFTVAKMCLGFLGFWPNVIVTPRRSLWALVNFLILLIGVVTELLAGFSSLPNNLEVALDTLCPAGTSAVTLLKMLIIFYYRNEMLQIVHQLEQLLNINEDGAQKIENYELIWSNSMLSNRLNSILAIMAFITCTAYNLKPLMLVFIYWLRNEHIIWKTPFNMLFPAVCYKPLLFPITYAFTAYTGYVTIFMFCGCDAFFFEFCSSVATLFKLLQRDVKWTFQQFEGKMCLSEIENSQLELKLVKMIKRHNAIIDLMKLFVKYYTIITLAHFVSAAVVIGISIINIIMFKGLGIIVYVAYTFAALSQLFVYCYGGTLVSGRSVELATELYCSKWYICNPNLRRIILLMLIRSQRSVTVNVPFFSPSLMTFASVRLLKAPVTQN